MRFFLYLHPIFCAFLGANAARGVIQLFESNNYGGHSEGWGELSDIVDWQHAPCVTRVNTWGVSSVKIAMKDIRCRMYKDPKCDGDYLLVRNSENAISVKNAFTNYNPGWNDIIKSFKCTKRLVSAIDE